MNTQAFTWFVVKAIAEELLWPAVFGLVIFAAVMIYTRSKDDSV